MKPLEILLVEDNDADVEILRHTLQQEQVMLTLSRARDGDEAMRYLRNKENPRPDLILLDLNMPHMDGREVLGELRVDADLDPIPVVVMTSSEEETDIARSYNLGAAAYVVKPLALQDIEEVVQSISRFWMKTVRYPNRK